MQCRDDRLHNSTILRMQAWQWAGDTHATKEGSKLWIAEMYGYVFAAAKHDMWHLLDFTSEYPPGISFNLGTTPRVLHYCMDHQVKTKKGTTYQFIKHWYHGFDILQCPDAAANRTGLFPHPPAPSELPHVRPEGCPEMRGLTHLLVQSGICVPLSFRKTMQSCQKLYRPSNMHRNVNNSTSQLAALECREGQNC
jgi:hypothetical protein